MIVVRFSVARSISRASWTTNSLSESRADVAEEQGQKNKDRDERKIVFHTKKEEITMIASPSSRSNSFGLPTKTLAIAEEKKGEDERK